MTNYKAGMSIYQRRCESKSAADEAEKKGLVADSMAIRIGLLEDVKNGVTTPEEMQKKLKLIQNQAHKKGLYTRNDFYKSNLIDLEEYIEKERLKNLEKLNKALNKRLTVNKNCLPKSKI